MNFRIHQDGQWLAIDSDGQRYEISEGPSGAWLLNICSIITMGFDTVDRAKQFAVNWDYGNRLGSED